MNSAEKKAVTRKVIGEILIKQLIGSRTKKPITAKVESVIVVKGMKTKSWKPKPHVIFKSGSRTIPIFSDKKLSSDVLLPVSAMIDVIEEGLPISVFRQLCKTLELHEKDLAAIIMLPISTLAKRKKRGYFSSTESERILRILELYKKAMRVFEDTASYARKWFKEPAKGLGGATLSNMPKPS